MFTFHKSIERPLRDKTNPLPYILVIEDQMDKCILFSLYPRRYSFDDKGIRPYVHEETHERGVSYEERAGINSCVILTYD